mmetsp:Transcript_94980/g.268277  ORF Transcript_94980/g.268277 Transcript_94980/m.268277 type:complete len:268 (+) Transcript_94980:527-1330(+)
MLEATGARGPWWRGDPRSCGAAATPGAHGGTRLSAGSCAWSLVNESILSCSFFNSSVTSPRKKWNMASTLEDISPSATGSGLVLPAGVVGADGGERRPAVDWHPGCPMTWFLKSLTLFMMSCICLSIRANSICLPDTAACKIPSQNSSMFNEPLSSASKRWKTSTGSSSSRRLSFSISSSEASCNSSTDTWPEASSSRRTNMFLSSLTMRFLRWAAWCFCASLSWEACSRALFTTTAVIKFMSTMLIERMTPKKYRPRRQSFKTSGL